MQLKSEKANKMLTVGITGGIGSGKTIVTKLFSLLGVPVYNADDRAKFIQANNQEVVSEIKKVFGDKAYLEGQLNRKYIAEMVFSDNAKLDKLNKIVHPRVGQDYFNWLSEQDAPYVLKEAAIFFEAGTHRTMDKMITVFSPLDLRIKRILQRDPYRSEAEVKNIISKQMSEEEKVSLADFVIYNDDKNLLIPQVLELDRQFKLLNG